MDESRGCCRITGTQQRPTQQPPPPHECLILNNNKNNKSNSDNYNYNLSSAICTAAAAAVVTLVQSTPSSQQQRQPLPEPLQQQQQQPPLSPPLRLPALVCNQRYRRGKIGIVVVSRRIRIAIQVVRRRICIYIVLVLQMILLVTAAACTTRTVVSAVPASVPTTRLPYRSSSSCCCRHHLYAGHTAVRTTSTSTTRKHDITSRHSMANRYDTKLHHRSAFMHRGSSRLAFHPPMTSSHSAVTLVSRKVQYCNDWYQAYRRTWYTPLHQQQRQQQQQQQPPYINRNSRNFALLASVTTTATILYNNNSNNNNQSNAYFHSSSVSDVEQPPIQQPQSQQGLITEVDNTTESTILATSPSVIETPVTNKTSVSSSPEQQSVLFSPNCLDYDHYSGVTIDLERFSLEDNGGDDDTNDQKYDTTLSFEERLRQQLQIWKDEGIIRGVWIHIPPHLAVHVPTCMANGFQFHTVSTSSISTSNAIEESNANPTTSNVLILSQWLPRSPSRLPIGPTHQLGVGCLLWHPQDAPTLGANRRLLVVQERSGPADIHQAAIRELYEETGLVGTFDGLLLVRQAHPNMMTTTDRVATTTTKNSPTEDRTKRKPPTTSMQRKASDLFFICQMTLQEQPRSSDDNNDDDSTTPIWTACPQEIAAIQWMTVQEYCDQHRWQSSPLYMELNRVILESASSVPSSNNPNDIPFDTSTSTNTTTSQSTILWNDTTLPVWVNPNTTATMEQPRLAVYTNTLYSVSNERVK
jgi:Nudix hydrolase domain